MPDGQGVGANAQERGALERPPLTTVQHFRHPPPRRTATPLSRRAAVAYDLPSRSMLKHPWWAHEAVKAGPFPTWTETKSPAGCKPDGGGCHRGQGRVGEMLVHRAVMNMDLEGEWGRKKWTATHVNGEVEA